MVREDGPNRRARVIVHGDPADHLAELFMLLRPRLAAQAQPQRLSMLAQLWFDRGGLLALREGIDLGEALGLNAAGTRTIGNRMRMVKRNRFLLEAFDLMPTRDGASEWDRCKTLATAVHEMARQWKRLGKLAKLPEDLLPHRVALLNAYQVGLNVPSTAQGLRDAVNAARAYSLEARPSNILANYL